ncbi:hypothetical protein PCE1_004348 [Barthelona sp. PCE]
MHCSLTTFFVFHTFFNSLMVKLGSCCIFVSVILAVVLIISSFSVVDLGNVAFTYNSVTGRVDFVNKYVEGRHLIGFYKSFISFPTVKRNIDFSDSQSIGCRSIDGLQLDLELSFRYNLDTSKLEEVYDMFMLNYETYYYVSARDTIRDVCSNFTAIAAIRNRSTTAIQMETALSNAFSGSHAFVDNFQLNNIVLPVAYSAAIDEIAEALQNILKVKEEQVARLVEAETEVLNANYNKNIAINQANAEAKSILTTAAAEASSIKGVVNATANAHESLKQNFFDDEDFLRYIQVDVLSEHDSSKLVFTGDEYIA